MRIQVEFNHLLATLEAPSSMLECAIDEILECESLTQLLLVILTAGNILNGVSSLFLFSLSPSSVHDICQGNLRW